MGPRRPRASEAESERGGALAGFRVQLLDDLHVIGYEADRRHDDILDALVPEGVEMLQDVRLEPRLVRRAAPALIDERPSRVRHARAATSAHVSRSCAT